MSVLVSIGSEPKDIQNLQMAKHITKFVSSLLKAEDHHILFAEENYTQKHLDDLSDWLENILFILYNGGNLEDYSDLQSA